MRLLVPITSIASAPASTSAAIAAVVPISARAAVSTVVVLGGIFLEALILLANVAEQIFAQFLGVLDLVGVGATVYLVRYLCERGVGSLTQRARTSARRFPCRCCSP